MADNAAKPDEEVVDGTFASPPCYMHEIDPAYAGLVDPRQARDVARWRKGARQRLIEARLAVPVALRQECAARIGNELDRLIPTTPATVVSVPYD